LQQDRAKIGTPDDPQYAKGLEVLQQKIASKQNPKLQSSAR
jgi:carboxyl-terminal processing protease